MTVDLITSCSDSIMMNLGKSLSVPESDEYLLDFLWTGWTIL